MKLEGTVDKVFYKNDHWASIRLKTKTGTIVCKGKIIEPVVGYNVYLDGKYIYDPTYGQQFEATACKIEAPSSNEGIIAYLSSGLIKGVGKALARRMVAHFGKNTLKIMETAPDRLTEVNGISKKKKEQIAKSHQKNAQFFALYNLLDGKITVSQATRILQRYQDKAVEKVKKNPYILIYDIEGIGFRKADNIAEALKIPKDSLMRVCAACYYTLKEAESSGHCFSTMDVLQTEVIRLLLPLENFSSLVYEGKISLKLANKIYPIADQWEKNKDHLIKKEKLSSEVVQHIEIWLMERQKYVDKLADAIMEEVSAKHIVVDDDRIYAMDIYEAETESAEIIAKMSKAKPAKKIPLGKILESIEEMEDEQGFPLGEQQKNMIRQFSHHRIMVLTGGPGTGKTTTIRAIINAWDGPVYCCAPTGKAAQRTKEATGHPSSTIHSLIPKLLRLSREKHWDEDKWEEILFVVDETSMMNIYLAKKILKLAKDSTILFVGDMDQLPPIGPGSFFKDLLQNPHVPSFFLTERYRNAGAIAVNSGIVNDGRHMRNFTFDSTFTFKEIESEQIQQAIIAMYKEKLKKYPAKEICVLVPMRKRSLSGTTILNEKLQAALNPATEENKIPDLMLRVGDRVMGTINKASEPVYKDGMEEEGVFNGDCGTITEFDPEENVLTIEFDDGRIAYYEKFKTDTLELCYAMTIHKSQGSEYDCVIIAMNKEHFIMLKRELLYTAITRAKRECNLLGNKQAYEIAISNKTSESRNTYLQQRINYFVATRS